MNDLCARLIADVLFIFLCVVHFRPHADARLLVGPVVVVTWTLEWELHLRSCHWGDTDLRVMAWRKVDGKSTNDVCFLSLQSENLPCDVSCGVCRVANGSVVNSPLRLRFKVWWNEVRPIWRWKAKTMNFAFHRNLNRWHFRWRESILGFHTARISDWSGSIFCCELFLWYFTELLEAKRSKRFHFYDILMNKKLKWVNLTSCHVKQIVDKNHDCRFPRDAIDKQNRRHKTDLDINR